MKLPSCVLRRAIALTQPTFHKDLPPSYLHARALYCPTPRIRVFALSRTIAFNSSALKA